MSNRAQMGWSFAALTALVLSACSGAVAVQDAGFGDGGTWYHDVLPVVQAHCQSCHADGGIAPFTLDTYADGFAHANTMAAAVGQGLMPPWKPSAACEPVKNSRRMSQTEIDAVVRWNQAGAPAGNPADEPPPPDGGVTGLPRVDATLNAGFDYLPTTANGSDDYHCLVIDPHLTQPTDIVGLDIQPGVRGIVHHVILFHASAAQVQSKAAGSTTGWTCFGSSGVSNASMIGGWVPGTSAQEFPATTGVRVPAGDLLIMQVHYNLVSAPPAPDRTIVKLEYAPAPVANPATLLGPIDYMFQIPPNAPHYSHGSITLSPASGRIWGALPHMHTLGTDIQVDINGACLIDIPQWDFHWQQLYFFDHPIPISAGASIGMTCTWNNPNNKWILFGESTSDEMCLTYFYTTQ